MINQKVRKIVFTGSTEVGKGIMAGCADQVKRVTLELGGKIASPQGSRHVDIGDGRKLWWQIVVAGTLISDCASDDAQLACQDVCLHRARRAESDECVGTNGHELLHGDCSRRTANAGGGAGDGHSIQCA